MGRKKRSTPDMIFDVSNTTVLTIILIIVAYPLYFVLISSISDPDLVNSGKIWFWPEGLSFDGYKRVFQSPDIIIGYRNSLIYTIAGTSLNLLLTLPAGYALSRKDLKGRKVVMLFMLITMYFSGGLIPTYLLVKNLGMLNSIWALIIPNAISVWNIIIAKTFFESNLPDELLESAAIDGCSNRRYFISIAIPLSKALIAVTALFYAVGHWNSYFNALIYLKDTGKYPLQLVLRNILVLDQANAAMIKDQTIVRELQRLAEAIKYPIIIVACLPVLVLYPFLQKYFTKGVLIGSIKG
ncbi:carbohydrate ABC transporter permease [Cohnella soli]|uniref:Carbohydrate ABC transporter permease n=1 Tax=Cohnella soli TaxID=425005 RepID=A0ABW0HN94_9BACL